MIWILFYLLVGLAAGLVAGLLGVGGGIINVPALSLIFTALGYDPAYTFHLAIGTSLGIIIFTSASAAYTHYRNGNIHSPYAVKIAMIGIVGAIFGAHLADYLPGNILKPLFGAVLCIAGVQMLLDKKVQRNGELRTGWKSAGFIGIVAGLTAGFFGVGGGVAAVPLMIWLSRFEPKKAVATSSMVVVAFALFGTITHAVNGWAVTRETPWALGYVHILALLCVALSSIFTARWGAQWANRIDPLRLKRVFAVMLMIIGLRFMITALL